MALDLEWRKRIDRYRDEFAAHLYRPLGDVELEGFVTSEKLTVQQAARREFLPMPAGTAWGGKWQYGWFRARVELPKASAGQRVVFQGKPGGESLFYINGQASGSGGWARKTILLSRDAKPGQAFELMIESYAGHGPRVCGGGPVRPEVSSVPEPSATQQTVEASSFGIWDEMAYQLWLDFETLVRLRDSLDERSLRVSQIDDALREASCVIDFELSPARRHATFAAARKLLAPLLECTNGSTAPTMFGCGHGHLDVAWLWPLAETDRKVRRTLANQLALIDEYPDYKFMHSQAHLYWMVKRDDPEFYERVRQAVLDGRIIADGGMWVEADTNITGGESLIRQFVHGMRFFREEFGVECEMLWLPDVFGYSGALPQILSGCGIKYFTTAKIYWNYYGGENFPRMTFTWEGIDGSTVLTHLMKDYNAHTRPDALIGRWRDRPQFDGVYSRLYPFGHGDGGGGPTRDHLEFARRCTDLEGCPRFRHAAPAEFFADLERNGIPDTRYVGELYFQAHRGTYTSQARTKKGNRKCELALRDAEMWSAFAGATRSFDIPVERFNVAWRELLLNQFHDILPGSSIHRVYEEAQAAFGRTLQTADETRTEAQAALTRGQDALTVFNSLNWERTELVPLPGGATTATARDGAALPCQQGEQATLVEVTVPGCGWTTIKVGGPKAKVRKGLKVGSRLIENDLLRLQLNDRGEIESLFDKEVGQELAAGVCNVMKMYKDVPGWFDAWDIDTSYQCCPVELPGQAEVEVVADGPLLAAIRVTRKLHNSQMTQEIRLRRGSRRVDFVTTIDWRERHKLLKVSFPVRYHASEALHEIQFGHIRRPNHYSRQFDADRFEVCNHKWSALAEEARGLAVLNDCKYGLNVLGDTINLTLLKSALAPDETADQGVQEFTYSIFPWNGSLGESDVVRQGYELNVPVSAAGGGAGEKSLLTVDAKNIVIETVKPAEDGSGDVIMRLYECKRTATQCELKINLPVAEVTQVDMLERGGQALPLRQKRVALSFRAFEIKTLRLKMK